FDVFAGKKSAQIREILISESAWEEMTCLFAPSLTNLKTIVQKFVLFYCALVRAYTKIRNFPGINIHNFYTNDARVRHLHPLIPYYGSVFIFK
ncbi:MAG: hypothetical protein E6558_20130, partial [Klebsiella pneumoniae]|nr:hypothetical protein [Klebsiella pneumoniae]